MPSSSSPRYLSTPGIPPSRKSARKHESLSVENPAAVCPATVSTASANRRLRLPRTNFFARRGVRPLLQRELQCRTQCSSMPFHLRIGEGQQLLDTLQGIVVLRAPFQNRPQAFRHHGANQRTLGRKITVGGRARYLGMRRQLGDRRKRPSSPQRHRAGQQQTVGFARVESVKDRTGWEKHLSAPKPHTSAHACATEDAPLSTGCRQSAGHVEKLKMR